MLVDISTTYIVNKFEIVFNVKDNYIFPCFTYFRLFYTINQ